ncbi:MAG: 2-isopropylmalate synthase [Firmicutes bacterium]|nr:2-isopropylmalate synthase [Bacillota bacterium]
MSERIYIFDTTLRDGEQSPGVSLNLHEKLEIARQLAKLNVDVIEAGFPIASPGDFAAVQAVAREVQGPVIAGLARANRTDIDRAWEALKEAERPRIHTFIATSDIHLQYKLQKSREEVLNLAVAAVKHAKGYTEDVEFSAEDAFRSDLSFLCEVIQAVIEAGATVVNIPDTVGYATPYEFGDFIAQIRARVPGTDRVILSVHCHNDLGLAVANSLAAIRNGAQQVECAVNGLGERAGNAALEEIVMALYTRRAYYQKETNIRYDEIYRTSRLVSTLTGMPVQPNKAVVGKNAFLHASGIHQDGVLQARATYEIMNPELVGFPKANIVLGKLSGRHALRERLAELGYILSDEELEKAFQRFKNLADRKKDITDRDLEAIVKNEIKVAPELYQLAYLHVSSGTTVVPTATVGLKRNGIVREEAACGDGPVDAAFKAVDKITGINNLSLADYSLSAITGGKDALGEVVVRVEYGGKTFIGRGLSTDIIEASVKAYLNAVNKVICEVGEDAAFFSAATNQDGE